MVSLNSGASNVDREIFKRPFKENVVYNFFAHKRTADVIVRKYFGKEASFDDRAVKKRTLPNKLLFRSQLEECIFKKFGLWFHAV